MNLERLTDLIKAHDVLSYKVVLVYLAVTILLTLIVFLVYKITFTGVAYSRNFNISIVLTGVITSMVIMVIGNNLVLSLGMVGALSIVRFRAAIKEPKDISYLFWSIAIGLSAGTGAILIAIIGTLTISGLILMFHFFRFRQNSSYLLIIKGSRFKLEDLEPIMEKYIKKYRLRMKNTEADVQESIYEVTIDEADEDDLIDDLYKVETINKVNIVSFSGHLNE
ncbi:DUF4956 domain-containing protein [Acidaminobacter sp. JC074]|uniref:DUF4956 domain-containing protein n=1 Tax=Acidaminobacter sp. JC074 TaxID=2530199 RepID=UPI001F0E1F32|nr:DUF4956 domain-containing protein [Acidaminobacter sp. JC074]